MRAPRTADADLAFELWLGPGTIERLADSAFVTKWLSLHRACPWATPFQHPGFVNTWYASYCPEAAPIVAVASDNAGELTGLLPLAVYEGRLVAAGGPMAEYQVWLARPEISSRFSPRAILAARSAAPGVSFQLKYIPADAPLADVVSAPDLRAYAEVVNHNRPLMRIDPAAITASLRKKSNVSRLNRLKREGARGIERINGATEFADVLDQIISLYDFRQGAVNGVCPFAEDARKRSFHLAWMAAAPEQLHVTVLRTADRVLSALVGVVGRQALHVAIVAHSPFHARHSPGKFHLMLAALELAPAGLQYLDLTPGGSWKERFADTHDQVFELRVHPRRSGRAVAEAAAYARSAAKWLVETAGVKPSTVIRALTATRPGSIGDAVRCSTRYVKHDAELRVYSRALTALPLADPGAGLRPGLSIRTDCVDDLLKFTPSEPGQSREAFLSSALARLESGQHVVTISDGERLLHHGWVMDGEREATLAEVGQSFTLPEASAVLYDCYTHPSERRRGHCRYAIHHVLRQLALSGSGRRVFAWVPIGNVPAQRAVETSGFEYVGSLGRRRRPWRDVRWRTMPETAPAEGHATPGA